MQNRNISYIDLQEVSIIEKLTTKQQNLITNNHNLIYKFMRQHKLGLDNVNDWYGVYAIGLCKAAKHYDEKLGKFSTLAYVCMNNEVCKVFKKQNRRAMNIVSLDVPTETGLSFYEIITDNENPYKSIEHKIDVNKAVDNAMKKMTDGNQEIIKLIIEDYISMTDVAQMKNISRQRVHQIMCKFRDAILEELK